MDTDGIGYQDENSNLRAFMTADGIGYFGKTGDIRAQLNADGIVYVDENGVIRAQMGSIQTLTPATGVLTRTPAQIVLYDAEFKVIWRAMQ